MDENKAKQSKEAPPPLKKKEKNKNTSETD